MARESLLPGWTVGHVLTHVARNADSHIRRAEAAMRGEIIDQYPGGFEGRAAEIEEGATRTAVVILDDLRRSSVALASMWGGVSPDAWDGVSRDVGGRERRLSALPARRWQELEVHLVDLGIGVTFRDWPDAFVAVWLPRLEAHLSDRLPTGHDGSGTERAVRPRAAGVALRAPGPSRLPRARPVVSPTPRCPKLNCPNLNCPKLNCPPLRPDESA